MSAAARIYIITAANGDSMLVKATNQAQALRILRNERPAIHMRTDHRDGGVTLTAIL